MESINGIIYGYQCLVNGKWYVGQTTEDRKERREISHRKHSSGCKKFANAIGKYGWDSFVKVLLDDGIPTQCALDLLERFWILELDSQQNGYNIRSGGKVARGYFHSEETKCKIAKMATGRKRTLESIECGASKLRNCTPSNTAKENRHTGLLKKWEDAPFREKMTRATKELHTGAKRTEATCRNISNAKKASFSAGTSVVVNRICVRRLDTGEVFSTLGDAALSIGAASHSTLSAAIKRHGDVFSVFGVSFAIIKENPPV